ncbi:hypothetical protein P3L10_016198 [Capsicum annuum]
MRIDVRLHLLNKGFWDSYRVWDYHGEVLISGENSNPAGSDQVEDDEIEHNDVIGMIHDAYGHTNVDDNTNSRERNKDPNVHAKKFYTLVEYAQTKLYPGCTKVSKLSFVVKLLHLKCLNHWSNKSMDELLNFLIEVLPEGSFVPKSFYEAKKVLSDLGLGYTKIDACKNDCILYWRDYLYIILPVACYALSPEEKFKLCDFLANLKVPDAFSSNISRCVNVREKKIHGLKCHDHHVLLQDILPVAIRGLFPKEVCELIIALGKFFKNLYSKCLRIEDLDILESEIPIILCKLEMVFPPTFFDVMIHLPIHLAREAKLGGPIQYRNMYPLRGICESLKHIIATKVVQKVQFSKGIWQRKALRSVHDI